MKNKTFNRLHGPSNEWTQLCKTYQNRSFLDSFKIKTCSDKLTLSPGNIIKLGIIMMSVPGVILLSFGFSFFLPSFGFKGFLDIFCCFIGIVGGGAMLFCGTMLASLRNKIVLNKLTSLATISYGFSPFNKRITCHLQDLTAHLYRTNTDKITEHLKPNDSVLSISHLKNESLELVISVKNQRDILGKVHEKIASFLGTGGTDSTWSEYELPNGETIRFQTTAIAKDKENENYRIYTELSPNVVIWERSKKGLWVWIASILIGGIFIPFPFLVSEDLSEFIFIACFTSPVTLFMLPAGLYFTIRYWKNRFIVIDKTKDVMQYQSTQKSLKNKMICKLSDIAFYQICFYCKEEKVGFSGMFELNCVDINGKRFNICNSNSGELLVKNATQLSNLLKTPLVDNTS